MKNNSIRERANEPTQQSESLLKRRAFMKYTGAGITSGAFIFSACDDTSIAPEKQTQNANSTARKNAEGDVIYLGSGDTGILNYAYALEQLEAAFYTMVVSHENFASIYSEEEQMILKDVMEDEVVHREFYKIALGKNAIPGLTPDFSAIDFGNRETVMTAARTFEDTGVAAYNGAGQLLQDKNLLLVAGKIVSSEARHASAIRDLIDPLSAAFAGDDVVNEMGLDQAKLPPEILAAVQPFVKETIDGSDLPTS